MLGDGACRAHYQPTPDQSLDRVGRAGVVEHCILGEEAWRVERKAGKLHDSQQWQE